jgi:hypothetical protein
MPHPINHGDKPFLWQATSVEEWLEPDRIHQRGSRIDRNPDFYDRCRLLLGRMRRATANFLDSSIVPVTYEYFDNKHSRDGTWASCFYSGVSRWLLLTNHPATVTPQHATALAVCLGIPGFDTDEDIEWNPDGDYGWARSETIAPERLAWLRQYANPVEGRSRLWIRSVFVECAGPCATFLSGSIYDPHSDDSRHPYLVATDPDRFERGWVGRMRDGYLSWTDEDRFLLFLNDWFSTPRADRA